MEINIEEYRITLKYMERFYKNTIIAMDAKEFNNKKEFLGYYNSYISSSIFSFEDKVQLFEHFLNENMYEKLFQKIFPKIELLYSGDFYKLHAYRNCIADKPGFLNPVSEAMIKNIWTRKNYKVSPILADLLEDYGAEDVRMLHIIREDLFRDHWLMDLLTGTEK